MTEEQMENTLGCTMLVATAFVGALFISVAIFTLYTLFGG